MKLLPLFCALLPSMAAWLTVSCDKEASPVPSPEVASPDSLVRLARTWNEWTFEMEYSKAPAPFSKKNLRRIVPLLPRDLQLHHPDYRAGDTLLNLPIEILGDTLQPQRALDLKFNPTFERLYHRTIGVAPHVCGVRKIIVQALHAAQPPVDLTEQARVIIPSYAYGGQMSFMRLNGQAADYHYTIAGEQDTLHLWRVETRRSEDVGHLPPRFALLVPVRALKHSTGLRISLQLVNGVELKKETAVAIHP